MIPALDQGDNRLYLGAAGGGETPSCIIPSTPQAGPAGLAEDPERGFALSAFWTQSTAKSRYSRGMTTDASPSI